MIPMNNPATASWVLNISDLDFAKLKRGILAQNMYDKWAFLAIADKELVEEEAEEEIAKRQVPKRDIAHKLLPDEELTDDSIGAGSPEPGIGRS